MCPPRMPRVNLHGESTLRLPAPFLVCRDKKREPKPTHHELRAALLVIPEDGANYLDLDARLEALSGLIFACCVVTGALTWVAKLQ